MINKISENKNKTMKSNETMTSHILKIKNNKDRRAHVDFVDREIGTLRTIYNKIEVFIGNVISYILSFFTKKKMEEVRIVFKFKRNKPSKSSVTIKEDMHSFRH